jgi:hypothetical protein
MDAASGMGMGQRFAQAANQPDRLGYGKPAVAPEELRERGSVEQLHCDEGSGLLAGLVDRGDVGAAHSSGGARLVEETVDGLGFTLPLRPQHLERNAAVVFGVVGIVHHRHPALPEQADDLVVTELVPIAKRLPVGR